MSGNRFWACAILLLPLATATITAEPVASRIERVEKSFSPHIAVAGEETGPFTLQERLRFYKVPGASVAVIHNGAIEWSRGYGVLSSGSDSPVTVETPLQAASLAKPVLSETRYFTAQYPMTLTFVQTGDVIKVTSDQGWTPARK